MNTLPDVAHEFETASREVLAFLHQRVGFDLWVVTRTSGEDMIVLQAEDHSYGVGAGTVFRWADSFCHEMVDGRGPCVAPDTDAVPAFAATGFAERGDVKAYIGVPLTAPDGSLFGTLCAIDPAPQPTAIVAEQELVELLGSMLSSILSSELQLVDERRANERLAVEAHIDPMTKLANRRAWDELLVKEEDRCRRYGQAAAMVVIDLDGLKCINDTAGHAAGDALIVAAAEALLEVTRLSDVAARLGGDEFGVLVADCDAAGTERFVQRLRDAFEARGVRASIGAALRGASGSLRQAWTQADERMYARRGKRVGRT